MCSEYFAQIKPCTDIQGNRVSPCEVLDESNRSITKTLVSNETESVHYFHWTLSKSEGKYIQEPRKNITFIASACTGRINLSISPPFYFPLSTQNRPFDNWTMNGTNGGDLKVTLSLDFGQYFLTVSGVNNSHFLITYIIHDKGDIDLGNNGEIMINSTKNQEDIVPSKDKPQRQLIQFYKNKINDINKVKFYIVSVKHPNNKKIYCGDDNNNNNNKMECNINSYCGINYIQQQNNNNSDDNDDDDDEIVKIYEVNLNDTINKKLNNNSIDINDENYNHLNNENENENNKISYYIPDLMFDNIYSFNVIMEYDGKYNFSYNGGYGNVKLDWKNKTFPDWLTYAIIGVASCVTLALVVVMIYNHRKLEAKCAKRKKRSIRSQTKKSK